MNHSRKQFCSFSIYIRLWSKIAGLVRKFIQLKPEKKSLISLVIVFCDGDFRDNFQWEQKKSSLFCSLAVKRLSLSEKDFSS